MQQDIHMIVRFALCVALFLNAGVIPQQAAAAHSCSNIPAVAPVGDPLDALPMLRVKNPTPSSILLLNVILLSCVLFFIRPVCYTRPVSDPTQLDQFRTRLVKTSLLTASS